MNAEETSQKIWALIDAGETSRAVKELTNLIKKECALVTQERDTLKALAASQASNIITLKSKISVALAMEQNVRCELNKLQT